MTQLGKRYWLLGALAAGLAGAALVGCGGPLHPAAALGDGKTDKADPARATSADAPAAADRAAFGKLAADDAALAFDLYARLGKAKPAANLAFSPYSVAEVMALPYVGARGDTAAQIAQALHYSLPADRLPPAFGALDLALAGDAAREPRPHRVGLKVKDGDGGAVIDDVTADSPAEKAGLKKGQVVSAVDGQPVRGAADFYAAVADVPGDAFTVETAFLSHSVKPYRVTAPRPPVNLYRLTTANAAWARKDVPLRPEFLQAARTMGAAVENLDFSNPEEARQVVNDWAAHKTEGGVKELLPAGAFKSDTGLVLTNALYFRGLWEQEFRPDATGNASFAGVDKPMRTPMMEQTGTYRIYSSSGFKIIELGFVGGTAVLDLILPDKETPLAQFEKESFTADNLEAWLGKLREKEVRLKLPRFKAAAQFDLKETLGDMGAAPAFGPKADFGGMTDAKELSLGSVVHQATLEVEERGATASAASGVTMRPKSAKPEDTQFVADHPFLFVLRDRETKVMLLMGRVTEPEKAQ